MSSSHPVSGAHLTSGSKFRKEYHQLILIGVTFLFPCFLLQLLFSILLPYLWFSLELFSLSLQKHLCEGGRMPLGGWFLMIFSFVSMYGSTYPHSRLDFRNSLILSGSTVFFWKRGTGPLYWRTSQRRISCFLQQTPSWKLWSSESISAWGQDHLLCTIIHPSSSQKGNAYIRRILILDTVKRACYETLSKLFL